MECLSKKRINPQLIKIASELGIELVITNDSHYTKKTDAICHDNTSLSSDWKNQK